MELDFFDRFFKNVRMSNFMKISPVGDEVLHADRQTDRPIDGNGECNSRRSFCESK